MNAPDLLAVLLDDGTFRSWDTEPAGEGSYAPDLARARAATGLDESVVTGEGRLRGRRVAVAVGEFGFLGGSIGVAAGERLALAAERARRSCIPFIVAPASGGTRMQEGTIAFMQMVKISASVVALKDAGLPYLVYLRHPTTGGVFASWASLGHVTLAEPGALIGFLGPRVQAALTGRPLPPGVQSAENLAEHGVIDAVVPANELAGYLNRILTALSSAPESASAENTGSGNEAVSAPTGPGGAAPTGPEGIAKIEGTVVRRPDARESDAWQSDARESDAWQSVLRTRDPGRPGAAELIRTAAEHVAPLRERDGLLLALARMAGRPCVIAGQDRNAPWFSVAALRQSRRGMLLAEQLRIPLVTVIDTPGAELSPEAEENGIASEVAECIATMIGLRIPTVSVLLGQGTGGGALALLPADRVIAAEHAWLAPLAPEGASAIVYKDTAHAPELAARQRVNAASLAADGIVDRVVPETRGAVPETRGAVPETRGAVPENQVVVPENRGVQESGMAAGSGDLCRDLAGVLRAELSALSRDTDPSHDNDHSHDVGLSPETGDTRLTARLRRYRDLGLLP